MLTSLIKKAVPLILCLVMLLCATACSEEKSYTATELSQSITNRCTFSELKELSGTDLYSYFGFQAGDVKRFNVKVSASGESADIIAVFELADSEKKETIVGGISHYLTTRSNFFKKTVSSEYAKLQSRILYQVDNTIILVVCSDYAPVTKYLTELGAKEIF